MKASKLITLDIDLLEKLRLEDNASGLINDLLAEYYKDVNSKKTEQLEDEKDNIEQKFQQLENELEVRKIAIREKEKQELDRISEEQEALQKEALLNKVTDLWKAEDITEEDYRACLGDSTIEGFDVEAAMKVLTKLEEEKK